jgi:hypothetical protein
MKLQKILSLVALVGALASCDVLDREPRNSFTDASYWKKVDDLKYFARKFYTEFPSAPHGTGYLDDISDITVSQSPPGAFFNTAIVPTGSDGWAFEDWEHIRGCNYFMARYHTVEGVQADINHYVGEIRFFRAMFYYAKVRKFGDVPWFDRDLQTTDTELLNKGRDPRLTVVAKIIEDLEYATTNMKLPGNVESGQLHKYCAWHLLSRVCLFEATWQKYTGADESVWKPLMEKAAAAAKVVIDSGLYSIEKGVAEVTMSNDYPLNYKSKFILDNLVGDKEAILSRTYDVALEVPSQAGRNRSYGLSKDFIEQFLDIDGKPIALSSKYLGDESILKEVQNRDPRLWNMVLTPYIPYIYVVADGTITSSIADILPGGSGAEQNSTGYVSTKFRDPDTREQTANNSKADWYIFRYAETLLNYAEAMCELGLCDQSVLDQTVNKLRARLDYTDASSNVITMGRLTTTPPVDPMATVNGKPRYGYDISPLLYEIRRERLVELAFEGFRWDDICRWRAGVLIDNPKTMYGIAVNSDVQTSYTTANGGTNPFAASQFATVNDWDGTKQLLRVYSNDLESRRKWNDKYYLSPLPQEQTTLNPNLLPQNPGW